MVASAGQRLEFRGFCQQLQLAFLSPLRLPFDVVAATINMTKAMTVMEMIVVTD
jgi:hypothetical protein